MEGETKELSAEHPSLSPQRLNKYRAKQLGVVLDKLCPGVDAAAPEVGAVTGTAGQLFHHITQSLHHVYRQRIWFTFCSLFSHTP